MRCIFTVLKDTWLFKWKRNAPGFLLLKFLIYSYTQSAHPDDWVINNPWNIPELRAVGKFTVYAECWIFAGEKVIFSLGFAQVSEARSIYFLKWGGANFVNTMPRSGSSQHSKILVRSMSLRCSHTERLFFDPFHVFSRFRLVWRTSFRIKNKTLWGIDHKLTIFSEF